MTPAHRPAAVVTGLVTVGALAAACAALLLCWWNANAWTTGTQFTSEAHAPIIALVRAAFLLIAVGLLLAPPRATTLWWTRVRVAAMTMLACSITADVVGAFAPGLTSLLGPVDDVHRRLLRLANMASRAVPLLALLAASCTSPEPTFPASGESPSWGQRALRLEPLLFVIGVTTLPTILAMSAVIHKEIAWALPIGADTTVAGCVMAAIRARKRSDVVALLGWSAVAGSMIVGLLMGLYAFEGPLPAPRAAGAYGTIARTAMRDGHIVVLVLGVVALALNLGPSRARGGGR